MFGADALTQTFHEPDSAMRLVQVRDFLAGQGWYDLTQYRLNPPEGVAMHWARWVDAAIAAPILMLAPVVGQEAAEVAVAFVWPLGLLAVFVFMMTRIAAEFGSEPVERSRLAITASVIAAMAFPTIDRFAPGALDHHNVVLVLIAASIWGLMKSDRLPWAGGLAGLALGLAVSTAAEALPFLLIGFVPALRGMLPKPGPWMERFRRLMALPMFLTALALVWLLGQQTGNTGVLWGLAAAMALALLLWWLGSRQVGGKSGWLPILPALASAVAAIALLPMDAGVASAEALHC